MRTILHCDLNNFFASVECRDLPELKKIPIAVCGNVEERKGVVLAKNELAKAFGITTGEPVWQAMQKCRTLKTVPPHFERYLYFSKEVQKIYARYTDLIEPFGIDECWLDVTGSERLFGTGEEIAHAIKDTVKRELGLTISVGVSFNKIFAKLGSDLKKPDAVSVITQENFKEKLWRLPVESIIGVGRATLSKLQRYGIYTIGDLAATNEDFLKRQLGVHGEQLKKAANGWDVSSVCGENTRREVKTVGNSTTCIKDLESDDEVWRVLLELSQSVGRRLRAENLSALGVQISIKRNDFKTMEFQAPFSEPVRTFLTLAQAGFALFQERYKWERRIRAVGIRAISLIPTGDYYQPNFFGDAQKSQRREKIEDAMDSLEKRYGKGVLVPLSLKNPSCVPDAENKPSFFH